MQKVKKTVERTIKERVELYEVKGGTEFSTEVKCENYEAEFATEIALKKRLESIL